MKIPRLRSFTGSPARRLAARAMTLAETMVAMGVFSLVVLGVVYTQMFCMFYNELAQSQMGASDSSRRGFDLLTSDIRAAKVWRIGNLSGTTFSAISNSLQQIGNSLQLSYTTDTNSWVRYYFNTNNYTLGRITNGMASFSIIATNLTNVSGQGMVFRAEDYSGSNRFDLQYKYVIATTIEFAQYQYPLTRVGPGYYYDYYKIQLRVASHNFN